MHTKKKFDTKNTLSPDLQRHSILVSRDSQCKALLRKAHKPCMEQSSVTDKWASSEEVGCETKHLQRLKYRTSLTLLYLCSRCLSFLSKCKDPLAKSSLIFTRFSKVSSKSTDPLKDHSNTEDRDEVPSFLRCLQEECKGRAQCLLT